MSYAVVDGFNLMGDRMESNANAAHREPSNKGKIVGQKAPFKVKDVWALRAGSRARTLQSGNPQQPTRP